MPDKVAVCIGQNLYAPESGVRPLRGCVNDALLIGELLRRAGFSVQQLHDSAATYGSILGAIEEQLKRLHEGDELLVWNASHGFQVPDLDGDESADALDEAICTLRQRRPPPAVGRPTRRRALASALRRARVRRLGLLPTAAHWHGGRAARCDPAPVGFALEVQRRMGMPTLDISAISTVRSSRPAGRGGALRRCRGAHPPATSCSRDVRPGR